ncbi:alanyl-tRNA editing protein [Phyllobacterium sp. YR531]|uniref:alanyl-tRNA editing protein n=1 Tax=Phyllobacterium sp. YR531 TaxID=1144343 RepID=UPI00026F75B3|nr:alanyl-tRNA editing protein [Phyllobacterium sp. YR531]EJN01656.1 putative metal-dependent hydrolase related to alanyl-tRNA synthetase HxxxH domain containing protein [Phyllobacterium sp. YR531]
MAYDTTILFRDDSYLKEISATVIAVNDRGGIVTDQTNFYATSGGQPGDTGVFVRSDGSAITIAATVTGETKEEIIHVPAPDQPVPDIGEKLLLKIDWERRYKLMRMHAACHLLSVVCPYPITGAAVSEDDSRVDFDLPDVSVTKESATAKLMELVNANHPIFTRWITEEELAANPGLIKSKNVRPPTGTGRIRLVCIGENAAIDSQPCGGTHVATTGEIGQIHIGKIEKKGKENRRFRIRFGALPEGE